MDKEAHECHVSCGWEDQTSSTPSHDGGPTSSSSGHLQERTPASISPDYQLFSDPLGASGITLTTKPILGGGRVDPPPKGQPENRRCLGAEKQGSSMGNLEKMRPRHPSVYDFQSFQKHVS